jgi:hypothetical protein
MELSLDVVSHRNVSSSNCCVKKHGGWFNIYIYICICYLNEYSMHYCQGF